jgi:hypothetical protein
VSCDFGLGCGEFEQFEAEAFYGGGDILSQLDQVAAALTAL